MIAQILSNRIYIVFIIPFILGLLTVLSFQPFNFFFINFILVPVLFLTLVYVNKKSKNIYRKKPHLSNLFFVGYLFGIGYFASGIYWISYSLTYDENFKYLIPFALIGIPMFLGIFFGLATLSIGALIKNNIASIFIFCASFSLADFLRSTLLSGFPWNLWAYSWSWLPESLQVLKIIGLYGFNLIVLTIFCSPALLIKYKKKYNFIFVFILIIMFVSNYLYGSAIISKNDRHINELYKDNNNLINVKIVSPNIDLKYNLSFDEVKVSLKKLIKYSEPDKNKKTIFIWPEGVFTGYTFEEISQFKNLVSKSFTNDHSIIFGINTSTSNKKNFNSLVMINNNFEILYQYNKKKLVPFGEFLPAEQFFNKFGLKKITQGFTSFAKGKKQDNLIFDNYNILPLICYEIIFPELVENASNETNLIINISEDAWFGGSIGPYQHFSKSIFRAIESDTFLLRSANQGISAFVNNKGVVIKSLETHERGHIELNVPLIQKNIRQKNDLIFLLLLFTYTIIFFTLRNKL